MADVYNPDKLKEDAIQKKLILDTAVDVQCVLQILIEKGMITKDDLDLWRERVRSFPKYKATYQAVQSMAEAADLYDKDPSAYLSAVLKAKMEGKIR